MKKIYSAPLTKVVKIKPVQIICSSPVSTVSGVEGVSKGGIWEGESGPGGSMYVDDKDFDDSGDLW